MDGTVQTWYGDATVDAIVDTIVDAIVDVIADVFSSISKTQIPFPLLAISRPDNFVMVEISNTRRWNDRDQAFPLLVLSNFQTHLAGTIAMKLYLS